jgi:hypothetical protein
VATSVVRRGSSRSILVLPLGTIGLSPSAEAAIALDIISAANGDKLGSIAFPAATGSSPTGVTFGLNTPFAMFSQNDITAVSWSLDPATSEILSLSLAAARGDDPCNPAVARCSRTTLTLTPQVLQANQTACPPPSGPGEPVLCTSAAAVTHIEFVGTAPAYACIGFEPPLADGPVTARGNRALPLKAELLDEDGIALTDADLGAAPVVQVTYHSGIGATPDDVSDQALWAGQGTDGNRFEFSSGRWRFNLKVGNYTSPGTCVISMISGDGAEYQVEPTCEAQFVVNP